MIRTRDSIFQEIGIAEILLLPTANLINKPVKASGFQGEL